MILIFLACGSQQDSTGQGRRDGRGLSGGAG